MPPLRGYNVTWWKNEDYAHLLVHFARELDARYKDRLLIALGHSPSWLVVAAGMLRAAEGRPRNTAFIPFTGRHCELDSASYEFREPVETILFRPDEVRSVSEGAVSHYFNYLARHRLDPETLRHKAQDGQKPVLVELASQGVGLASFLEVVHRKTGGDIAQYFDIVAYKLNYQDGRKTLGYIPETKREAAAPDAVHPPVAFTIEAEIISGEAGSFFDRLAGGKGVASRNDASEAKLGRFMPFYPVVDGYKPNSYFSHCAKPDSALLPPPSNAGHLREIKAALKAAIAAPQDVHAAHVARGLEDIRKSIPAKIGGGWVPVYRGYH